MVLNFDGLRRVVRVLLWLWICSWIGLVFAWGAVVRTGVTQETPTFAHQVRIKGGYRYLDDEGKKKLDLIWTVFMIDVACGAGLIGLELIIYRKLGKP